ncbi:hypothetical protein, partial [Savagea faecisuis]
VFSLKSRKIITENSDVIYATVVNEHNFIKDFTEFSVANVIVKNGVHAIDTNSPIREVKAAYEAKYGEVEWLDDYSAEEIKEPDITVLINETKELELTFNPTIEIDRLPLPSKVAKNYIPRHLAMYVTEKEIEAYNAQIPDTIKKIETYNKRLEEYMHTQIFGLEFNLSIRNEGNLKANDIHIVMEFPEELVLLEGSKKNIKKPEEPSFPPHPLTKRIRSGALDSISGLLSNDAVVSFPNFPMNNRTLPDLIISPNTSFYTDLNENIITGHCDSLLHTRHRTFNTKYLLVPTMVGTFDINVSIICEEYQEPDKFTIQLIVAEN